MPDELSGNLPNSAGEEGAQGGVADEAGPIDPEAMTKAEAEAEQEPTAVPPWTHMLDGCKARVLSPRGEPGDELHIEVLVPEGEPAPGVEARTIEQSLWDERAVPFTVDQAEAEEQAPLPAPWTHIYKGLGTRVVERKDDETRGPVVVIECDDRSTRTVNQSTWEEQAEPIDQGTGESESAEASKPTLVELATLAGVKVEPLPDESFILRGKDLPEGGLFVEPDKLRALLERIRDGTWREV